MGISLYVNLFSVKSAEFTKISKIQLIIVRMKIRRIPEILDFLSTNPVLLIVF